MENNTTRNGNNQSCLSQPTPLSFYEENYILEPDDYDKDNDYLPYEGDEPPQLIFN